MKSSDNVIRWERVKYVATRRGVDPQEALLKHLEQRDGKRTSDWYMNTPTEAARVGWNKVQEYCIGDRALPYVEHDHMSGLFYYRARFDCPRCNISGTAGGHLCEDCGMCV